MCLGDGTSVSFILVHYYDCIYSWTFIFKTIDPTFPKENEIKACHNYSIEEVLTMYESYRITCKPKTLIHFCSVNFIIIVIIILVLLV